MNKLISLDERLFLYINKKTTEKQKHIFTQICNCSKPFFIIVYLVLLCYVYFYLKDLSLFKVCVLKPFSVLISSKLLRIIINRDRPYIIFENLNLPQKKEASMPSNHTASSFIISLMYFYINSRLAIVLCLISAIVSFSRIIIGIHFPLDILAGFLLSIFIFLI